MLAVGVPGVQVEADGEAVRLVDQDNVDDLAHPGRVDVQVRVSAAVVGDRVVVVGEGGGAALVDVD